LLGIGLSYTVFTIILFGVLLFPRQMWNDSDFVISYCFRVGHGFGEQFWTKIMTSWLI
jgi:hypothetical protein